MTTNYTKLLDKHLRLFVRDKTTKGKPPRPKTIEAHRLQLERLCYKLDNGEVAFTVNGLMEYMIEIDSRTGQANVNQAITAINGFLNFLAADELITLEFIKMWELATEKMYRSAEPRGLRQRKYFQPRELEEIVFQLSQHTANPNQRDRDTAFFSAILLGPTRLGDLIRANIGNVKFCKAGMTIGRDGQPRQFPEHLLIHLTEEQTKDHDERDILIFAGDTVGGIEVLPFFRRYYDWRMTIRNADEDGPFFTSTRLTAKGRPGDWLTPRNMFGRIARHAKFAGIRASAHMFRGTWAEINGGNLESREIRQLLGHSADKTSQTYTDQKNPERLLRARLRASQAISDY